MLADDRATAVPTATIGDSPVPKLWRGGPIGPDFNLDDVQPRLVEKSLAFFAERAAAKPVAPPRSKKGSAIFSPAALRSASLLS